MGDTNWVPPLPNYDDPDPSEQSQPKTSRRPRHGPGSSQPSTRPEKAKGTASLAPLSNLLETAGPPQSRRRTAHEQPSPPEKSKEVKRRKRTDTYTVPGVTFELRPRPISQMHPPTTSGLPENAFQSRKVPDAPWNVPDAPSLWSDQEDAELIRLRPMHTKKVNGKDGTDWDTIAEKMKSKVEGFDRSGKACKLRFNNYLSERRRPQ